MNSKRGAFVVLEGCDRSGKSTQARQLVQTLEEHGIPAKLVVFPNRTTSTGKLINSYLTGAASLNDHVIHLLFSANRWEFHEELITLLESGTTVVCDRYSFSGVAYSAAKPGMCIDWCKAPEIGLPKPDLVMFLKLSERVQKERSSFGEEVYEKPAFQRNVNKLYEQLSDETWQMFDADGSRESIHDQLVEVVLDLIKKAECKPLAKLW